MAGRGDRDELGHAFDDSEQDDGDQGRVHKTGRLGPVLDIRNGRDRPEKAAGKEGGEGRAGCPDQPSDAAGGLLRATAKRRGGVWGGGGGGGGLAGAAA